MIADKERALLELIGGLDRAAVAFSGGVDSSLLLAVCIEVLGPTRVVALTADSPLLPRAELATARQIAVQVGAELVVLPFDELTMPAVRANDPERCYYCKQARFEALQAYASELGEDYALLHGENADDAQDYRPGSRAAHELAVRAPLAEAGLTKAEIRELSRRRGLPTWNHPSASCLATRIPTGTPLSSAALARIEQAEIALHALLGDAYLRVRDHYPVARLEVLAEDIARLAAEPLRAQVAAAVQAAGYRYVSLDLNGYRMGSMNANA